MPTRIEIETMELIKAACREFINSSRKDGKDGIDWEQRRYEIARDLYAANRDATAERCVAWADDLISELKKKGGVE